jgi:hypothetical protein
MIMDAPLVEQPLPEAAGTGMFIGYSKHIFASYVPQWPRWHGPGCVYRTTSNLPV